MLVAGVIGTFIWSYLFELWVALDTPLLKFVFAHRLWPNWVPYISMSLFSLVCSSLFVLPLWFFMRRTLYASATIFITAFLAVFFVPVLLTNEPILLDALFSLTALWLFVFGFIFLIFLASRFTNERERSGK